jgi:hypothetical protein
LLKLDKAIPLAGFRSTKAIRNAGLSDDLKDGTSNKI